MLQKLLIKLLSGRMVLWAMELLCLITVGKRISSPLFWSEQEISAHKRSTEKSRGYIEDQRNYKEICYGESTIQAAGCEIIAAYNAVRFFRKTDVIHFFKMIPYFEKNGSIRKGKWGTSPKAVKRYLESQGFFVEIGYKEDALFQIEQQYEVVLYTFYNNKENLFDEVHSICLTKEAGKWYGHNVYGDGTCRGPYVHLTDFFLMELQGKAKLICYLAVRE